jgi:hypothetical protein
MKKTKSSLCILHSGTNKLYGPLWEANSRSANEEISHLLWHPRALYFTLLWVRWIQSASLHPISANYFNIILPSMSRSPKWFLPFIFSASYFIYISHLSHAWLLLIFYSIGSSRFILRIQGTMNVFLFSISKNKLLQTTDTSTFWPLYVVTGTLNSNKRN